MRARRAEVVASVDAAAVLAHDGSETAQGDAAVGGDSGLLHA